MKKYLLGIAAIAMAIGLSAFKTSKKISSKAFTYRFQFSGTSSTDGNIFASINHRFTNWFLTTVPVTGLCDIGSDIACLIELDAKYTHEYGGTIGRKKTQAILI